MKGMGFRQSNAWLHTWAGLVLGWLLFAVFVTGTLSFFRDEISGWMRPELHASQPDAGSAMRAVAAVQHVAPGATAWSITLPNERRVIQLQWNDAESPADKSRGKHAVLDAATGEQLHARNTRGADFFYRFHFELYGMPYWAGRWVVGTATMFMLVALLSGIVTHKKIFADFFTFRRRKGQRSWMDVHNVLGVLALPFHLLITYSGLILLMATLMPWAIHTVYRGDASAAYSDLRGDIFRVTEFRRPSPPGSVPLTDLAPLIEQARQRWPHGIASIAVAHAGTPGAIVELQARVNNTLSGRGWGERMRYSGVTGEPLGAPQPPALGGAASVYNVTTALHMAHYVGAWLRWLCFFSGVLGSAMVATGLILWVVKRLPQQRKAGRHFGHRLVECLNVGAIAGLLVASQPILGQSAVAGRLGGAGRLGSQHLFSRVAGMRGASLVASAPHGMEGAVPGHCCAVCRAALEQYPLP